MSKYFFTLHEIAYPTYDCEDCIGMKEHGCWCARMGSYCPGTPKLPWWALLIRRWPSIKLEALLWMLDRNDWLFWHCRALWLGGLNNWILRNIGR